MHQAADQQSRQHNDDALVVRDDHSPTYRRQVNVVDRGHRILMPIGSADSERDKRRNFQMLSDVAQSSLGEAIPKPLSRQALIRRT